MQILLHLCCGPCTAYPLITLREQGHTPQGFFFNPNIHPYREFKRRISALESLSEKMDLEVEYEREYGLKEYLRKVVFNEEKRCLLCYSMRLEATASKAKEIGADAFSSTLLYSRYQQHEAIKTIGEEMAEQYGVPFHYQDFRQGWQQGIDMAIDMDIYRQPYCGCIYSEQERYDKKFRKRKK
jgi:predicted adenine nucleotide alpha hydrolase (AANH) superfamily ATPase